MNEREKKLAIAVAAVVVLWFGNKGWDSYQDTLQKNRNASLSVEQDLAEARLATARGKRAEKKLLDWQERSLPTDSDFAKSLYQDWLRQQLVDAGLQVKSLGFSSPRSNSKSYQQFTFDVSASGRLPAFTEFLYKFYDAPHLHRLSDATLVPSEDRKSLTISLTIDALSLPAAEREDALATADTGLLDQDSDQFKSGIADRNLFATYKPPAREAVVVVEQSEDKDAAQAVFSGIHSGADGWLMLVRMQESGKIYYYREGDQIRIGRFRGTVEQLDGDRRRAIVATDSDRVQLDFGKSLAEAHSIGQNAG